MWLIASSAFRTISGVGTSLKSVVKIISLKKSVGLKKGWGSSIEASIGAYSNIIWTSESYAAVNFC